MRAPSKSIQHSSTPSPEFGVTSFSGFGPQNSCTPVDNRFIMAALYLSETTPLSLHFGEPYGSPFFFRVIVEGMPYSSRAFGDWAKNSRHITPRPKSEVQGLNSEVRSSSYPIISSTPESPYPHASPPSETEAGIAPPYPACC